jgi:hypothetical protein
VLFHLPSQVRRGAPFWQMTSKKPFFTYKTVLEQVSTIKHLITWLLEKVQQFQSVFYTTCFHCWLFTLLWLMLDCLSKSKSHFTQMRATKKLW